MNALTPLGVSRMLARGIRECYLDKNQDDELAKLSEFILELAMSRSMSCKPDTTPTTKSQQALLDGDWLEALGDALESEVKDSKGKLK